MAIDATAGGASSNSYVSLEEADDYFEVHPQAAAWAALTEIEKETGLRRAAFQIDQLRFHGRRRLSTQALQWPRDYKGLWPLIPPAIRNAACEQAVAIARNPATGGRGRRAQLQLEGVQSFTIGELTEVFHTDRITVGVSAESQLCIEARSLLQRYIDRMGRTT